MYLYSRNMQMISKMRRGCPKIFCEVDVWEFPQMVSITYIKHQSLSPEMGRICVPTQNA